MNLTEKDFIDQNDELPMMDMSTWINFNAYTSLGMNFLILNMNKKERLKLLLRSSLPHPLTKHL